MKVYHLSPIKNRVSIQKNGLIPKEYKGRVIKYKPRIFVSSSQDDLAFDFVDYDKVDVWELDIPRKFLRKDKISRSPNHFYINFPVREVKLLKSVI